MDGLNPVAWRPCHDCGAHVGSGRLVFGNPSGGRLQSFNGLTHEASGCRFCAARVGAQPYGVGGHLHDGDEPIMTIIENGKRKEISKNAARRDATCKRRGPR
jgi:hypothetical protein